MRELYDAIVIGHGPAACLFAKVVAEAGGRVALLDLPRSARRDASDWIDYWLVPRDVADSAAAQRLALDAAQLETLAERTLEVVRFDQAGPSLPSVSCALVAVEDFRLACLEAMEATATVEKTGRLALDRYLYQGNRVIGAQAASRSGEVVEMLAPVVVDTTRSCARVDVRPTEFGLFDTVVWGRYHGVCREAGPKMGGAMTFRGLSGSRFWLLPMNEDETQLGVEVPGQPAGRVTSPAQLWEDELVGCHPLAERLMNARLLEACQLQRACYPHGAGAVQAGLITLEELDAPSPLAFRWQVLDEALAQAEAVLCDHHPKAATTGRGS